MKLAWLTLSLFLTVLARAGAGGEDGRQTLECSARLKLIFEALQAYRRAEGNYPESLTALQPRFIADIDSLSCPVALASRNFEFGVKEFRSFLKNDPSTSYNYELNLGIIWAVPGNGTSLTSREFKLLQRRTRLGEQVPIVRCCNHDGPEPCLNLSFAGRVYSSASFWETRFRDLLPHPYLMPEAILRDTRPISDRIPVRPGSLSSDLADLTRSYNGCLSDNWVWGKTNGLFAELERDGLLLVNGTPFDARGIIQLDALPAPAGQSGFSCPMFPTRVNGVAVPPKARRLHLLMGTVFTERIGATIADVRIKFSSGFTETIPIIYGRDVVDSFGPGMASLPAVWTNAAGTGRLYLKSWTNPRPDEPLASCSITSAMSYSAPFLIAITARN